MGPKDKEATSRRLESICQERLHAIVTSSEEPCSVDGTALRDRLTEELSIIKKRRLTEGFLLLYDCIVPVANRYPVTVRGRAGASFVIWLFGLCHYNPMRFGTEPEIFFGDYDNEDDPEVPLYFDFNIPEKVKRDAVERIADHLEVILPKEMQKSMDDRRVLQINLRTACRSGNNVSCDEETTHLGEALKIDITHPDWKNMKKGSVISLYIHTDMDGLSKLAELSGIVPQNPEKDIRTFSLFTPEKAEGLGLYGTKYIRDNVLAYEQPEKLEDLIKVLALTQGLGDRMMSQIHMIQAGTIGFDDVVATVEDLNGDRNGIVYAFSAVHIAEYAWIALALAWYRVRSGVS